MTPILRSIAAPLSPLLLVLLVACGSDGGDDGPTDPDTEGDVRVTVTADAAPQAGVDVSLFEGSATTPAATGTTSGAGTFTFQDRDPGAHAVEIDVPAGLVLAAGETDRKSVGVTAGQTASVSFALETEEDENVVEVVLSDELTFTPSDLTISPGTTVRWKSESSMLHTVTPDGHSEWSEATLASSGETFTHTFTAAGTFDYYCSPHLSSGMTGTVVVQ